MYYQIKKDSSVVCSAFRVTRANFNGEAFDNAPFEGDTGHTWLEQAMVDGVVSLVPGGETTYAVWGVRTPDGEIVLASPGDYILQVMETSAIHVCPGPVWELLTEFVPEAEKEPLPTPEEVEQVVEAAQSRVADARARLDRLYNDLLRGQADNYAEMAEELKGIREVLGEHIPETHVAIGNVINERRAIQFNKLQTEWCEAVTAGLSDPAKAHEVNWRGLHDQLNNALPQDTDVITMSRTAFQLFGTVNHLVACLPEPSSRYFTHVGWWEETIATCREYGEKFLSNILENAINQDVAEDVVLLEVKPPVVPTMTPSMVPEGSLPVHDTNGNLIGSAHVGQAFEIEPREEPTGGSFIAAKGVADLRELEDELAFNMNAYNDRGYSMLEKVKQGEQSDWKAFHEEGKQILENNAAHIREDSVFANLVRMAGHLAAEEGPITHIEVELARIKADIVTHQKKSMYDELEVVNTVRMWIFEAASTEERDWVGMQGKLWRARVVLSIHNALPEDFEKIVKAVDHMVGSYPLEK